MTGKLIDFQHWAPFCRDAKRKPDAHSMMKAAEHKRILENAERTAVAMAELAMLDEPNVVGGPVDAGWVADQDWQELPCDVEPIATTKGD